MRLPWRSTTRPGTSALRCCIAFALGLACPAANAADPGSYPVDFIWTANAESDVTGYRLYYGTQSGVYTHSVDAGNTTTATIVRTTPGTFYVAAVAYNSVNLESRPSTELAVVVSATDPVSPVFTGVPGGIVTLPDTPGGSSAVVSWTEPVATDNVGVVTLSRTHAPGQTFPAGTTDVSYMAEDAAGNRTTASFSVTVAGFQLWTARSFGAQANNPALAGAVANADGDRWANLGEYVFDLQPASSDGEAVMSQIIEDSTMVLRFAHNPYLPDVILRLEISENLAQAWQPLATRQPSGTWTLHTNNTVLASERVGARQAVTIGEPLGTKSAAFFRLVLEPAGNP